MVQFAGSDRRKDEHAGRIMESLGRVSTGVPDVCLCDIDRVGYVRGFIQKLTRGIVGGRITVDITTLTKRHLLVILKTLREALPCSTVRLLYTPGIYGRRVSLSWGVKSIGIVPFFGGMGGGERGPRVLVLFLGYEGERAWAVWKHVEPDRTIAVIGNPPTHPGDDKPSVRAHREILDDSRTTVRYASALSV
jgi:hypothetical protein